PTSGEEVRSCRNVSKSSIVVVVIKVAGGRASRRETFQRSAIDEEDVGPAIVVVIKDGHSCSGALQNVSAAHLAAKDIDGGEPGLLGDIYEFGDRCRLGRGKYYHRVGEYLSHDHREENKGDPTWPEAPQGDNNPSSAPTAMTRHGAEVFISPITGKRNTILRSWRLPTTLSSKAQKRSPQEDDVYAKPFGLLCPVSGAACGCSDPGE